MHLLSAPQQSAFHPLYMTYKIKPIQNTPHKYQALHAISNNAPALLPAKPQTHTLNNF
jgi:hypothetical protein